MQFLIEMFTSIPITFFYNDEISCDENNIKEFTNCTRSIKCICFKASKLRLKCNFFTLAISRSCSTAMSRGKWVVIPKLMSDDVSFTNKYTPKVYFNIYIPFTINYLASSNACMWGFKKSTNFWYNYNNFINTKL